jgi:hypothetical protein
MTSPFHRLPAEFLKSDPHYRGMEILTPFLWMFERHNGMAMKPVEDARAEPAPEDPFEDAFAIAAAPSLTLVASR